MTTKVEIIIVSETLRQSYLRDIGSYVLIIAEIERLDRASKKGAGK